MSKAQQTEHRHGIYIDTLANPKGQAARGGNLPEEDALVRQLRGAVKACHAVLDAHADGDDGHDCDCNMCDEVRGTLYNLENAASLVEGYIVPVPDDDEDDDAGDVAAPAPATALAGQATATAKAKTGAPSPRAENPFYAKERPPARSGQEPFFTLGD